MTEHGWRNLQKQGDEKGSKEIIRLYISFPSFYLTRENKKNVVYTVLRNIFATYHKVRKAKSLSTLFYVFKNTSVEVFFKLHGTLNISKIDYRKFSEICMTWISLWFSSFIKYMYTYKTYCRKIAEKYIICIICTLKTRQKTQRTTPSLRIWLQRTSLDCN